MNDRWQNYFSHLIKRQPKGIIPAILRTLLLPVSWGFRLAGNCRNWAFERRFLRTYSPPVPLVISIGNIVAGGTGKTPVTMLLAHEFDSINQIAILTRGYRSPAEKRKDPTLLSSGSGIILHPSSDCGDEPFLLARNLPKAIVIVGKNRRAAAHIAVHEGAKLIILDDGMQHRRLDRDLDIVVMHADNIFGHGHFLPRGLLRESPKSLERADLIILNHIKNSDHYSELLQEIKIHTSAPVVGVQMKVRSLMNAAGKQIETLNGKKVGLFCGIGHPEQFQATIQKQGADIIATQIFPDHRTFDRNGLIKFAKHCKTLGAEALVCTEKDFVKLIQPCHLELPIIWPKMHLCIVEGETHWKQFIDHAKSKLHAK
jgi:tetraacyldisaccharide 4'-kinase